MMTGDCYQLREMQNVADIPPEMELFGGLWDLHRIESRNVFGTEVHRYDGSRFTVFSYCKACAKERQNRWDLISI